MKKTSRLTMAANLPRKKMHIHQNDEIRYVFTLVEHSYNNNLKNIFLWSNFGTKEKTWANRARLVGLFEIEWKTPHHNILVEFLNNWKLDLEHKIIKVMLGDEQTIINKHVLAKVLRICHT